MSDIDREVKPRPEYKSVRLRVAWWTALPAIRSLNVLRYALAPMPHPFGVVSGSADRRAVVLRGQSPAVEVARRNGVSEQAVHTWQRQGSREPQLETENEDSKSALGEAHVQLRVWRKG